MVGATSPSTAFPQVTIPPNLSGCLAAMCPVSLEAIDAVSLQNRLDTKFLFTLSELPRLIEALTPHYQVLEIGGQRLHGYQTLYFDTPGFRLYNSQHAGRPERYKVRTRRYTQTRQSFLEVKHKNRRLRTIKNRIATTTLVTELDAESLRFVRQHLPFDDELEPKLWNRFSRITLSSIGRLERITLDLDVAFGMELLTARFPGLVVAELKQEHRNRNSMFLQEMRLRGIHETGFSKYCIGAAVLNSGLKHNRFKPELLRAQRLSERYQINE